MNTRTQSRTARSLLTRLSMLAGGAICWALAAPASGQAVYDLYTVSNTNTLMRVDLGTAPSFSATSIGVTQDAASAGGTVRRIRGLAYTGTTMYGVTREGDIVTVDPTTGQTSLKGSVATTGQQFWSGLAWDAAGNDLYAVNAFGDRALAKFDLGTMTSAVQGPTAWAVNGTALQMLGVAFSGSTMYASNRQNMNVVQMNPANGSWVYHAGNATSGVSNPQQIAFHPGTGVLYAIHDTNAAGNNASLSTFDAAFQSTTLGVLPFGIVEAGTGGNGTYGWGGIAFVPVPGAGSGVVLGMAGLVFGRRRR